MENAPQKTEFQQKAKHLNSIVIEELQHKMITKTKLLSIVGILALLILSISAVSALSLTGSTEIAVNNNQTILRVTNDELSPVTVAISATNVADDYILNFPTTLQVPADGSATFNVAVTEFGDAEFGRNAIATINIVDNLAHTDSLSLTQLQTFCKYGQIGELEITDVDISNEGEGDKDEWGLMDEITIEVKVENTHDTDKIKEIFVELALYDSEGKNVADDLVYDTSDEEKFDLGNLADGDEETATFTFRVPADFTDGTYRLAVKSYSDDLGERNACADLYDDYDEENFYQEINIERESDEGKFIAFDNIAITPTDATCGDEVTIDLTAFNIGDEEQDQVKIILVNKELGINLDTEIKKDMAEGDDEKVSFTFIVPANTADKTYNLELDAEYDYSNGIYRETLDEVVKVPFKVIGCSAVQTTGKVVSINNAILDSEAIAGKAMTVKATIENLDLTSPQSYVIDASGYESWATLDSISERILTVSAGSTNQVTFTFTIDKSAEGTKEFTVYVTPPQGGEVETRTVQVNIEPASAFGLGGNSLIWVIGIVNLVLVILIIVVAVRLSRR